MLQMKAIVAGDQALKQVQAVQREWEKGLLEERNEIRKLYKHTTATWEEHHPRFYSRAGSSQNAMWVDVWTENRIYWFVHESISVLRAVFSGPKDPAGRWRPKTQPRRLTSRGGSGRMVYASKEISLPPYEAREFTEKIIEVEQKPFQRRMEKATQDGVKKGP